MMPAPVQRPCPACPGLKDAKKYLCRACWLQLPAHTRRALNRRDNPGNAAERLMSLYRQIKDGTPLRKIEVAA